MNVNKERDVCVFMALQVASWSGYECVCVRYRAGQGTTV